jgi:hypothetical protein
MAITAKPVQFESEGLVTGLGEFTVVEFNKETNSKGEEITYLEEKDGITQLRLNVTLKEASGKFFNTTFYLQDKEVWNKANTSKQYINERGRTWYSDSVENLPENFREHPYHVAKVGEADLVNFILSWLKIDRNQDFKIDLDWKALMKGNVKELNDLVKTDLPETILGMACVRVVTKDNETKEYQNVSNRAFTKGYNMKHFRTKQWTPNDITDLLAKEKRAKETKSNYLKQYEDFILRIAHPEYGIKDIYYLGPITAYVPGQHIVSTDKTLAEDDSSY